MLGKKHWWISDKKSTQNYSAEKEFFILCPRQCLRNHPFCSFRALRPSHHNQMICKLICHDVELKKKQTNSFGTVNNYIYFCVVFCDNFHQSLDKVRNFNKVIFVFNIGKEIYEKVRNVKWDANLWWRRKQSALLEILLPINPHECWQF